MKTFYILPLAVMLLFVVSCDNDDEVRPFDIKAGSSSFEMINECDFSSGSNGTEFFFQLELASEPSMPLGGIEFDLEWSDGDVSEDIFEDDFIITGAMVEFDWCFRFGSTDWFEIKAAIVDEEDGKKMSNDMKIRVNKPAGAN